MYNKVLVTGAGGFIGSHLTEQLINTGIDVRAIVRYNARNNLGLLESLPKETIESTDIFVGDLRDMNAVESAVKDVDAIFHLAAYTVIPYSYIRPVETIESNIMSTLNILMAAKETGCKVINISTSEVYGTAQYVPINEAHPLQPQSPYSASKIGAESIATSFYNSYDLPIVSVRPFNTYGPRQSARDVIPSIISQAITKKEVLLGSTNPTRDLTYVKDTVNGIISALNAPPGEIINIGSGCEISIGALADKIISLIDDNIKIKIDENRIRPKNSEVHRLFCDNTKAKQLLHWKPEYSLDDGLIKTIEWISKNIDVYKTGVYNV